MKDEISKALEDLSDKLPEARLRLTPTQIDQLISSIGPRTARAIVNAKKDFPIRRIPFLFSSVDTQAVVDLLANDVESAIERALKETPTKRNK